MLVAVRVGVGGTAVAVRVGLGGTCVAVPGTEVAVWVAVAGIEVEVRVGVAGMEVEVRVGVAGTEVAVGVAVDGMGVDVAGADVPGTRRLSRSLATSSVHSQAPEEVSSARAMPAATYLLSSIISLWAVESFQPWSTSAPVVYPRAAFSARHV